MSGFEKIVSSAACRAACRPLFYLARSGVMNVKHTKSGFRLGNHFVIWQERGASVDSGYLTAHDPPCLNRLLRGRKSVIDAECNLILEKAQWAGNDDDVRFRATKRGDRVVVWLLRHSLSLSESWYIMMLPDRYSESARYLI